MLGAKPSSTPIISARCCVCHSKKSAAFSISPPEHVGATLNFCSQSCYQNWEAFRSCAVCSKTCIPIFSVNPPAGFGRASHFCSKYCFQQWSNKAPTPTPNQPVSSEMAKAQPTERPVVTITESENVTAATTAEPANTKTTRTAGAQVTFRPEPGSVWSDDRSTCDGSSCYTGSTWRTGDSCSYISCSTYGTALTGRTGASQRSKASKRADAQAEKQGSTTKRSTARHQQKPPDMFAAQPISKSPAPVVQPPAKAASEPSVAASMAAVTLGIPDNVAANAPSARAPTQRPKPQNPRAQQPARHRQLWEKINPMFQKERHLTSIHQADFRRDTLLTPLDRESFHKSDAVSDYMDAFLKAEKMLKGKTGPPSPAKPKAVA
eukprot:TRINITY_DN12822_c0_g1_i1.p1 TRINITY_DN12822_c0_g1~~TRINITY_DN12822_c0_g1_i1.p1  ORF type:complete len:378 (-),score=51.03 TRINITY_DN12822_c0_g1_i1:138-1271(-)